MCKNTYIIFLLVIFLIIIFYTFNNILKYKTVVYENFENDKIPKIIIQTWKTKDIPEKYKENVLSVKKYNTDYQFLFFSDDDIEYFLENNYPEYYQTYLKLPVKIQKIDFFRYVAIYHYGGFYFDLDITALYPLDELLDYDVIFPLEQNIPDSKCYKIRFKSNCEKNIKFLLGQYAFGAKPQNDFIKLLIDTINNNIDKYIKDFGNGNNELKNSDMLQYVYNSTGPDFVTELYLNYKNKDKIKVLEYEKPHYFGKYAVHMHYGTWKLGT